MSTTPLRAAAAAALATTRVRQIAFPFSVQKRTLFFCGPKPTDHDPAFPVSEHYHARLRSTTDAVYIGESLLAATSTRAQSPSLTKTVFVAQARAQPKVLITSKISVIESHLVPATATATNTVEATIVALEIKKLEDELERGGVSKGEMRRMREEIEVLKGGVGEDGEGEGVGVGVERWGVK